MRLLTIALLALFFILRVLRRIIPTVGLGHCRLLVCTAHVFDPLHLLDLPLLPWSCLRVFNLVTHLHVPDSTGSLSYILHAAEVALLHYFTLLFLFSTLTGSIGQALAQPVQIRVQRLLVIPTLFTFLVARRKQAILRFVALFQAVRHRLLFWGVLDDRAAE